MNDRPLDRGRSTTRHRYNERVQIHLKSIGDRVVIDARGETARPYKRFSVDTGGIGQFAKFVGSTARMFAAPAANVDAELGRTRSQSPLERAHDGCRDAGRMPVHAHDGAERLKPEWIAQPRKQFGLAVMVNDALANRRAERRHARRKPCGHAAAMERKIGGTGTTHQSIVHCSLLLEWFDGKSSTDRVQSSARQEALRFQAREVKIQARL